MNSRFRAALIPLLIVAATAATFGRIIGHQFTSWDDASTIAYNPNLNPPSAAGLQSLWTHPRMGLYVPVTYTLWSGLAWLAHGPSDPRGIQLNPAVFHAASILLHALTACIVYLILRRFLTGMWGAAVGALLFALHPVQVEAVAWASGMKDVLCGLLTLLALWQYLTFTCEPGPRRYTHYRLALLAFMLAMLAKPTAVVAPLMALALDTLCVGRPWRQSLKSLLPWFAIALPIAILARVVQPAIGVDAGPWWARPLIAIDALWFYLHHLCFPFTLGIDYGRRPDVVLQQLRIPIVLSIAFASFLFFRFSLFAFRRGSPREKLTLRRTAAGGEKSVLACAIALFIIPLLPVLGFMPFLFQTLSTVADHYLYLPMFAVAMVAAFVVDPRGSSIFCPRSSPSAAVSGEAPDGNSGISNFKFQISNLSRPAPTPGHPRTGQTHLAPLLGSLVLLAMALRSGIQAGSWRDDYTLFRHAIAANRNSFMAYNNLGKAYEMDRYLVRATEAYQTAVAVRRDFQVSHLNLGACLAYRGLMDESLVELREGVRLETLKPASQRRDVAEVFFGVGEILLAGRHDADAARLFEEMLRVRPDHVDAAARLTEIRNRQASLVP